MVQDAPQKFLDLIHMTPPNSDESGNETQIPSHLRTTCMVLRERGWILEKMAVRLAENLAAWNVLPQTSYLLSSEADINHWMHYYDLEGGLFGKNTLLITQVDRAIRSRQGGAHFRRKGNPNCYTSSECAAAYMRSALPFVAKNRQSGCRRVGGNSPCALLLSNGAGADAESD